jgi:hypothetical protein
MAESIKFEKQKTPDKSSQIPEAIPAGIRVTLIKRNSREGSDETNVGDQILGVLAKPIEVGTTIEFKDGQRTSTVARLYADENRLFADTRNSTYEIVVPRKNFEGLSLKTEQGEVSLPIDAAPAQLGEEIIDQTWRDSESGLERRIYINKPALKDVLLDVHNGEVFRAMEGRLIVLARVGNIHVPFYTSLEGNSGKNKGEWYPFFGFTGGWVIKGSRTGYPDLKYHSEMTRVQDRLNENLIIPVDLLSPKGKIGNGISAEPNEPGQASFDIGRHLKYQNVNVSEFAHEKDHGVSFVRRITGYAPQHVSEYVSDPWIKDIVDQIR